MNSVEELQQENAELKQQNTSQQQRIRCLEEMLITSRQQQFGSSSEKHSPQQSLFNEVEADAAEFNSAQTDTELIESIDVPAHTRQTAVKLRQIPYLPIITVR